ncbi:MAG TPA: Uma2 family endonuclease [Bryobacteraceae bacterium]|jgi:Uma2 family endonuclease|nr:Uma2 family endonuclease [Bryobacteraceae bacterium]
MSTQPKTFLSEEEYLAIERKAPYKSEYYRGEIFAMAGAGEPHNLLASNLILRLGQQFLGRPCRVYGSDMRVHVPATAWYTYPDISAVCGEPQFRSGRDNLLNPSFIAEVLSESTERYDRGRKFELYQSIPSLSEYLLVASDHIRVDLYTRQANGKWLLTSASSLDESITIDSICCTLNLADLYDKVQLEEAAEDQNRFL